MDDVKYFYTYLEQEYQSAAIFENHSKMTTTIYKAKMKLPLI